MNNLQWGTQRELCSCFSSLPLYSVFLQNYLVFNYKEHHVASQCNSSMSDSRTHCVHFVNTEEFIFGLDKEANIFHTQLPISVLKIHVSFWYYCTQLTDCAQGERERCPLGHATWHPDRMAWLRRHRSNSLHPILWNGNNLHIIVKRLQR